MSEYNTRYLIARMSQRNYTAIDWAEVNPILLDGEIGVEKDTGLLKIGNGTSHWNNLPYQYNLDTVYEAGKGIIISNDRQISTTLQYDIINS